MPRFSIIVTSYNNAEYLPDCLESIRKQDFDDWETVVVVDASPDNAAQLAHGFAAEDKRFVVVDKAENGGLHLARCTGVDKATGDYLTFIDGDDELEPGALSALDEALREAPCDMMHFGIHVVDAGEGQEACEAYEQAANRPQDDLTPQQALHLTYEEAGGYRQTWRAVCSLYAADLAQRAFGAMTTSRLERAEDSYEYFVLSSLGQRQVTRTDIVGYRYYFGRGVSSSSHLGSQRFLDQVHQFVRCMDALDDYAQGFEEFDARPAAAGARAKLEDIMFNDWKSRVADDEKLACATQACAIVGKRVAAEQLMRLARDEAYHLLDGSWDAREADQAGQWAAFAQSLAADIPATERYARSAAAWGAHVSNLAHMGQMSDADKQPVRILVAAHKPISWFDSKFLQPIHVGSAGSPARFWGMLRDDAGQNISHLNPAYCELTAQYWAWKNIDAATTPYVGLCHYRRYFDFASERHVENDWGEVMDEFIDEAAQARYGLDDQTIMQAVEGFDVVTTQVTDLSSFPDDATTPLEHWHAAPHLHDQDLLDVCAIAIRRHPEYEADVEAFLQGGSACFCNMFIMRKPLFDEYSQWLFGILDEFMESHDMGLYSAEGLRTPGHLGERLLNVFLLHLQRCNPELKWKQVQCVHFTRPDPAYPPVFPAAEECHGLPIVPVVFAADGNYVPMLSATMYSMLCNASEDFHYDITVLATEMSAYDQQIMRSMAQRVRSATVNFVDAKRSVGSYRLSTNNPHIGIETYYRFLIQDALPYYDKVLYLDSDLIIEGDVAELFATELGDNLVAAVRDIDYLGNLNMPDGKRLAYTTEVLGMRNPYDYFQAGVLVFNTAEMRRLCSVSDWMEQAQDDRYIYNDQDILNARCEGRVVFLDPAWNVMHDCNGRIANFFSFAPAAVFADYQRARGEEKVIHYAGFEKPWNTPDCDRAERYWAYARETPFYEKLLGCLTDVVARGYAVAEVDAERARRLDAPVISQMNPVRMVLDPLMPMGSPQRESARRMMQRLKGID